MESFKNMEKSKPMFAMYGHMNMEMKPPSFLELECLYLHLEI